jgi:hypothetical protein
LDNEKTVDTSNGGQLTGGSRGQWGNLRDQIVKARKILAFTI